MSRVINLAKAWTLEDHVGGGGFDTVYRAHDEDGAVAAIKLVPKVAGRSRELLLAQDVSGLPNVVGLEDFGEDGGEYILVMPLADRSLDDELAARGAPVPVDEAIPILNYAPPTGWHWDLNTSGSASRCEELPLLEFRLAIRIWTLVLVARPPRMDDRLLSVKAGHKYEPLSVLIVEFNVVRPALLGGVEAPDLYHCSLLDPPAR
jgi:hypothetical protein